MFSMREFIRTALMDAVGKMPDYWVILNAAGWQEKGILIENDLADLQEAITAKNTPAPVIAPDPLDPMMGIMDKGNREEMR